MKYSLLLLSSLFILSSCDAPQATRVLSSSGSSSYSSGSTTTGTNLTTTTTTTTTSSTEAGFENCSYSISGSSSNLGTYGVCQSTVDETIVKVKPSLTDSGVRTCLIPTYKDSTGASLYIGQPQCFYPTASTAVKGQLYKNRTGYSSYTLNGLMVIKEKTSSGQTTTDVLNAYFNCMDAYAAYRSTACPYGYAQNAICATAASSYRDSICTSFKNTYSAYYIDMRLK